MDLEALVSSWKFHPGTRVIFPSDPSFAGETERWNTSCAPTFKAAICPGSEEDAQKAVQLAISHNVPFLATSGRHGYNTTFGALQDGLAIDLGRLDSVSIDKEANTVTVGGGILCEKLVDELYAAGREIPIGLCSQVGYLGFTLGGGIGRQQGMYGLGLDSLLSVRIVTGTGEIVTASKESNSDLFWGLRGAGHNFGVVTSATYKVYPLANGGAVQSADLVFTSVQVGDVFKTFERLREESGDLFPPELSAIATIVFSPEVGEATVVVNLTYPGPVDSFHNLAQPFLNLKPIVQVVQTVPFNKATQSIAFGVDSLTRVKGKPHSIFGANVRKIDATTWTDVFHKTNALFASIPGAREGSVVVLEMYNSEVLKAVPEGQTAYPWRDSGGYALANLSLDDPSAAEAIKGFGRQVRHLVSGTSGYDDMAVYVNYCHGDETLEQRYGADKLPRLRQLKQRWDPANVFRFHSGI